MTFDDSILIDAEASALFGLTQDYKRRLEWDPFLRSATLLDGAGSPGVGVRALCVDRNGTAMETEYVSFNPPRAVAIKMTRGPWFLESFAGSWRFERGYAVANSRRILLQRGCAPDVAGVGVESDPSASLCADTRRRLAALKKAVERHGILVPAP